MYTLAVSIHLIVCFLMIASILLQAGKGAEIGASFGGSSQTVFGSRGPGTFLSKVTVGTAIVFMLSSLSLAMSFIGTFPSQDALGLRRLSRLENVGLLIRSL